LPPRYCLTSRASTSACVCSCVQAKIFEPTPAGARKVGAWAYRARCLPVTCTALQAALDMFFYDSVIVHVLRHVDVRAYRLLLPPMQVVIATNIAETSLTIDGIKVGAGLVGAGSVLVGGCWFGGCWECSSWWVLVWWVLGVF
jgi:hypothetical protein